MYLNPVGVMYVFSPAVSAMAADPILGEFKSMLMGIDLCENYIRQEQVESRHALLAIQAAEYLDSNINTFVSIEDIANEFHICRNHFTRIFSEFWHCSPQQYQIHLRIPRAKNMLEKTDNTMVEIASELGYADHYFFSRQFSQQTGMSPGSYRKTVRNKKSIDDKEVKND